MDSIEYLGLAASVALLVCVCIKSHTVKGNILMRITNIIGSILFVVYGCFLHAYSIIITNTGIALICIYYLIKLMLQLKNEKDLII